MNLALLMGGLLGAQFVVLGAHSMIRRWGVLPLGLVLGALAALGTITNGVPGAGSAREFLQLTCSANLLLAFTVVYAHDGPLRARSFLIGVGMVQLLAVGWLLFAGTDTGAAGTLPALMWQAAAYLGLVIEVLTVCLIYQFLVNRFPWLPRVVRMGLTGVVGGLLGVWVEETLAARPHGLDRTHVAERVGWMTVSVGALLPGAALYLRAFTKFRRQAEAVRPVTDIVWWRNSYMSREHAEDRHSAIAHALPDPALLLGPRGEVVEALAWPEAMPGPHPDVMRGKSVADLLPGAGVEIAAAADRALKSGACQEATFSVDGPEGKRHFTGRAAPYFDPVWNRDLVVWVQRDVTQETRQKSDLERRADDLEAATRASPAALALVDGEDRLVWISNPSRSQEIMLADGAKPGCRLADVADAGARALWERLLATARNEGASGPELAAAGSGNDRRRLLCGAARVAEDGPRRAWCVLAAWNVTGWASAERSAELENRIEAFRRMGAGIAHEFNNMLVGITGHASLALQNTSPVSRSHLNLEQLLKAGERAVGFTQGLLSGGGFGEPQVRVEDPARFLRQSQRVWSEGAAPGVETLLEAPEGLPPIALDPDQGARALRALVHAASRAGGRVTVSARPAAEMAAGPDALWFGARRAEGAAVALAVEGRMGEKDTRAALFDPFAEPGMPQRGMEMIRTLGFVRAHHGSLSVDTDGRGSLTLALYLPGACDTNGAVLEPADWTGFRGTGVALVVDDEEAVRAVAAQILERLGFTVHCAPDGKEGIDLALAHLADLTLVLLDMTMPVMSGEETFRGLRLIKPDIRILLTSGYSEPEAMQHFTGRGRAAFLQKPFTVATLSQKVADLFASGGGRVVAG